MTSGPSKLYEMREGYAINDLYYTIPAQNV